MAVTESGHLASREVDDLYRRHGGDVYRYAYAVLGNHADAEDITQTTFLNAYRSLEQGVRPRKPSNWLLTIASNAIKQRFRHDQARPQQVQLDDRLAESEVADDGGPSVGELLTALAKIPPQQRQAIVLREFEGRSYAEIASILGVTTSALETLLFRARRSLAEEIDQQLTCTEAQFAVSQSVDGRLGRKERRRLRDHLVECPDCATFARLQKGHRSALRGLLLIPIPVSLTLLKGLQSPGPASAATVPATATGVGAATVGVGGLGTTATGGGLLAGGVALKAAAVVVAVGLTGSAVAVGAKKVEHAIGGGKAKHGSVAPGKRLGQTAPRGALVPGNGVARGKAAAPGQKRRAVVHSLHGKTATGHARPSHTHSAKTAGSRSSASRSHAQRQPRAHTTATAKPTKPSKPAHTTSKQPTSNVSPSATPKAPTSPTTPTTQPTPTPTPAPAPAPATSAASPPTDTTHVDSGNHNGADNGNVNGNGDAIGNDKGK